MGIGDTLTASVGKNINTLCPNGFHDPALNHCAHFVSHVLDMRFSFNCKEFAGGNKPGANIRVHEVFAQCPKVGKWDDADLAKTQLIFVTRRENVDIANKKMINIPQKHVGVFHDGKVFHYGNTADKVVTDTPASFFAKFEALYDGTQGLFFGWIPGEDLLLDVRPDGTGVSAEKKFVIPDPVGGIWRAKLVGEATDFVVGKEVNQPVQRFYGIRNNIPENHSPVYRATDYLQEIDHWAVLLQVTGACESENRFNLVNTYDRAKFTFGFYQLAAHTPRDNLILLFHRLAALPAFKGYFPELEIRAGRLVRKDSNGAFTDLEQEFVAPNGETQILLFMNYLNPNRVPIDRQEVLQAARLIHWCGADPEMRRAQVRVAAEILQGKMMKRYQPKLGLDGRSDVICAIVADIFHQGRARFSEVKAILDGPSPVDKLLKVNDAAQGPRNRHLATAIKAARDAGLLGNKVYKAAANEFV